MKICCIGDSWREMETSGRRRREVEPRGEKTRSSPETERSSFIRGELFRCRKVGVRGPGISTGLGQKILFLGVTKCVSSKIGETVTRGNDVRGNVKDPVRIPRYQTSPKGAGTPPPLFGQP